MGTQFAEVKNNIGFRETTITALGHSGFLVEFPGSFSFVFDPYEITQLRPVDVIFVTHAHGDHCDPKSILQMLKEDTKIVAPEVCKDCLAEFKNRVEFVHGEDKCRVGIVEYRAIPAYNINKFREPGVPFHLKEMGGVGFVVEANGTCFYHAGDTDFTPEMAALKDVDVAFIPVSGKYVMTAEEGVEAASKINPDLAIPMHFGKVAGSVEDAEQFRAGLRDKVEVAVLMQG